MADDAFLRQVLEHPEDDAPRLIYADWLMERDDPRGEFIRVQCQLARWAGPLDSLAEAGDAATRSAELRAREQALLAAHGNAWSQPIRDLARRLESLCTPGAIRQTGQPRGPIGDWAFRRGFIEEVTLDADAFLLLGGTLFEAAPVRQAHFTVAAGRVATLAASEHLGRLTGIDLSHNYLTFPDLRALLGSPHLGRLTALNLSYTGTNNWGARVLAESPRLARLAALDLSRNQIGMEGVRALILSPYLGQLGKLTLAGNGGLSSQDQEFLTASFEGTLSPGGLQALLELLVSVERDYTNAHARDLVRRAAANPAESVAVLGQGLRDSRRKVRAAAAQQLGRLGARAAPNLAGLVQRLYERSPALRDTVAPTLARVLPGLPAGLQSWLCHLANPLLAAENNLRGALEGPRPLPDAVRSAFAAICSRRTVWRARNAGQAAATEAHDTRPIGQTLAPLLTLAEQAAVKHASAVQEPAAVRQAARNKECAWLIARLCELLQRQEVRE